MDSKVATQTRIVRCSFLTGALFSFKVPTTATISETTRLLATINNSIEEDKMLLVKAQYRGEFLAAHGEIYKRMCLSRSKKNSPGIQEIDEILNNPDNRLQPTDLVEYHVKNHGCAILVDFLVMVAEADRITNEHETPTRQELGRHQGSDSMSGKI